MKSQEPKTLYFIRSAVPTSAELTAAKKLKGRVLFRNASVCSDNDSVEKTDFVAGAVPKAYAGIEKATEEVVPMPVDIKGRFLAFGESMGIVEITAETSVEEDIQNLQEYNFKRSELSADDLKFIEETGLSNLLLD